MALFQYWNFNRFGGSFTIYRANIMKLCKIGSRSTYHKCLRELHHAGYIRYHPAINRYLPVKVSMRRLDLLEDAVDSPQLDLFNADNPPEPCSDFEPLSGPELSSSSPETGPLHGPKSGHIIKQRKHKQENCVLNTHTNPLKKISMKKNEEKKPAAAPKSVEQTGSPQHGPYQVGQEGGRTLVPTFSEIEQFFRQNGYPSAEAQKFWLYNRSRGWMLSDNMPIWNWQPLAHKWMLKDRNNGSPSSGTNHLITKNDKNYDEPL
ncbi:MAG: hypothetical protein JST39_20865 [Bacteroidetes bacterium]|nr:hypothetical protein [Bacteroidota bacterium]